MTAQPEPELLNEYRTRVVPALREKHGYANVNQIPRLTKVVLNTSIGSANDVKDALEVAKSEMALVTGQKPIETIAKKSIAEVMEVR